MSSENNACGMVTPVDRKGDDDKFPNFEEVKKVMERSKNLWCDPDFKPSEQDELEWKRPHDIVTSREPKFQVGTTFDRGATLQGKLHDCWLISTIADLAVSFGRQELLHKVVPPQSFDEEYEGKFKFRFWQYGEWIEVFVDDLLPVKEDGKLKYAQPSDKNEFWCPLLEKAYAKLCGSYAKLHQKQMTTALVDFTGGINDFISLETFRVKKRQIDEGKRDILFSRLLLAHRTKSLMGCSIYDESDYVSGLVKQHCYSITSVLETQIENHKEPVKLVRLRNPWGGETTWEGAFTPSTPQGRCLGQTGNGEFWMTLEEFVRNFDYVESCHVDSDCLDDEKEEKIWEKETFHGKWEKTSAGGKKETFWSNPQYRLTVSDVKEGEEIFVIIGLLQQRRMDSGRFPVMGLEVYKILTPDIADPTREEFVAMERITPDDSDTDTYQICINFFLQRGDYLIVPYYENAGQEGEYLLRIFSNKKVLIESCDKEECKLKAKDKGWKDKE